MAMDWNIVLEILKWLVPIGGFGSVAKWFMNRTERELKRIRDSHDAYKAMYEDLQTTVKEDINEKQKLRKTIASLQRAVNKVFSCRHFPDCPVNIELLRNETDGAKQSAGDPGQRSDPGGAGGEAGDDPGVEGGTRDSDGKSS
jgi:hypothetical protein